MADDSNGQRPNRPRPKRPTQRKSVSHTPGFYNFFLEKQFLHHVGNFEKEASLKLGQRMWKEWEYCERLWSQFGRRLIEVGR